MGVGVQQLSGSWASALRTSIISTLSEWMPAADWATVAAGSWGHSLALKTDGSLWAWGLNHFGELGDGTTHDRSAPTRIGAGQDWMAIAAGSYHSLGLKTDGSLWAWGENEAGQLGDGTTEDRLFPIRVGSTDDWVAMAAGYHHSLGLRSDGSLWAWGDNEHGQVGDGTRSLRSNPTRIGSANDWVAVAAGSGYSLALQSDGSLWAWGNNEHGQLGDYTTTDRLRPTLIERHLAKKDRWSAVSGSFPTLALKPDGSLWAWGFNAFGGLGDGTTVDRHSPFASARPSVGWRCRRPATTASD